MDIQPTKGASHHPHRPASPQIPEKLFNAIERVKLATRGRIPTLNQPKKTPEFDTHPPAIGLYTNAVAKKIISS